jgi:PAS domain S-box-containing protein
VTRRIAELWHHLPLRAKGAMMVAVPVLPLLVTAALFNRSQRSQDTAQAWVVHTWHVRYELERVLATVVDAETAVRGFLLSKNREWLAPYNAATVWLPEHADAVARLVADDPEQQAGVVMLRKRIVERLQVMARVSQSARSVRAGDPDAIALIEHGQELTNQIRRDIEVLSDREARLLAAREGEAATSHARLAAIVYGGTATGVAGGLLMTVLLSAGFARRIKAVGTNAALLAQGVDVRDDEAGDEIGELARGLGRAIRERKSAEEALRRTEQFVSSVLDNIPDAVYVKDAVALRFVRVNRAAEELTGVSREQWFGRTDADLFPADQARAFRLADEEVLRGGNPDNGREEPIDTVHRGRRVLYTKKIPLLDGDGVPAYLLGVSHDITDQKAAEEAVHQARNDAERANRAKSDFLSRMSHDLRTPLNAILGFAQLLQLEDLGEGSRESVEQIRRGGRHLLALINEVLDIAQIEAGRLSLSVEPVDALDSVQLAAELVRPLAVQRGITLHVQAPPRPGLVILADRQRLAQILLNLLSNAVKYNRPDGRVAVGLEPSGPDRLRITVQDTGGGIPPAKLALLFEPFERLGAEQTAIEGTGLGLALSRGLAEAMGGTLGVISEVDRGSTFWVELPLTDAPLSRHEAAPEDTAARLDPPATTSGVLLYVEDNRSNVRLMERVLQRRPGVRLVHAPSGADGLRMARDERPDLIFLDLHLPDMPGEEVLRQLKDDPRLRPIPVAILSADAMPDQPQHLKASGAIAYLTKPLEISRVLRLLDDCLASPAAEARDV